MDSPSCLASVEVTVKHVKKEDLLTTEARNMRKKLQKHLFGPARSQLRHQDPPCSTQDLIPCAGVESGSPALGAQNLNHWTKRKVPGNFFHAKKPPKNKLLQYQGCLQPQQNLAHPHLYTGFLHFFFFFCIEITHGVLQVTVCTLYPGSLFW